MIFFQPSKASPPYLSSLVGMRKINICFTYHAAASASLQGTELKQTVAFLLNSVA